MNHSIRHYRALYAFIICLASWTCAFAEDTIIRSSLADVDACVLVLPHGAAELDSKEPITLFLRSKTASDQRFFIPIPEIAFNLVLKDESGAEVSRIKTAKGVGSRFGESPAYDLSLIAKKSNNRPMILRALPGDDRLTFSVPFGKSQSSIEDLFELPKPGMYKLYLECRFYEDPATAKGVAPQLFAFPRLVIPVVKN